MSYDLKAVVQQFQAEGEFLDGGPYGTGHINDTFAIRLRIGSGMVRYILQRINHNIFKNVPSLMDNILRVTSHLRSKLAALPGSEPDRETLTVIPALDGAPFCRDAEGNYWRMYIFIEGARTYDAVQSRQQAFEAAKAFGLFQKQLLDLPGGKLHETIPDFHHTAKRFAVLESAIEQDACNRAVSARGEIEFALAHKDMSGVLVDQLDQGRIPERITHNDTKINNVMFDDVTGRGVCVIDLDTVMPGLVLYDFGDQVRTTTGTAAEDERDVSKVTFQIEMFEALVAGYLEQAGSFLIPAELDYLAFCGKLITFEIGIRFLTDYLQGDVYFKTHRQGHNLDRARTQFEMVRQMEAADHRMEAIVATFR